MSLLIRNMSVLISNKSAGPQRLGILQGSTISENRGYINQYGTLVQLQIAKRFGLKVSVNLNEVLSFAYQYQYREDEMAQEYTAMLGVWERTIIAGEEGVMKVKEVLLPYFSNVRELPLEENTLRCPDTGFAYQLLPFETPVYDSRTSVEGTQLYHFLARMV